jgi:glutaminase
MRPLNLNDDNYRLFYAAYHNDVATMELLSKFDDFKVNAYDYDGRTALHISASECNVEAIIFLLGKKANPHQKDSRGNTAIDDAERYHEDTEEHQKRKKDAISTL